MIQICDLLGLDRLVLKRIAGTPQEKLLARQAFAQLASAKSLFEIIRFQLSRENVIGWSPIQVSEEIKFTDSFNHFPFSGFHFSWLQPLVRPPEKGGKRGKSCPVAFDIYGRQIGVSEVESFLERLRRAGYRGKLRILGVIGAPAFSSDAWKLAKNSGLWTINLRHRFGDEALETLVLVEKIVAEIPRHHPEFLDSDLTKLADSINREKTDPIISNLKSHSFQALTALLLREEGFQNVEINLDVPYQKHKQGPSTTRDVDVSGLLTATSTLRLVECKAELRNKPLDPAYVRKFYKETVPAALKFFRKKSVPFRVCQAEIWTTGLVNEIAKNELIGISLDRAVEPVLRDYNDLSELVPTNLSSCKKLLAALAAVGIT